MTVVKPDIKFQFQIFLLTVLLKLKAAYQLAGKTVFIEKDLSLFDCTLF